MEELRLLSMGAVGACVLALFGLSEWIKKRFQTHNEATRKMVHVGAGILTLSFPFLFVSHFSVLLLSASFLVILLLSQRFGFLESINGIDRRSYGSIAYPVIIYICFFVYTQKQELLYYFLPLLIFILCDPLAAWIGIRTRWLPYKLGMDNKTVAGTLAFFSAALALSMGFILFFLPASWTYALLAGLAVAGGTTLAEALSPMGSDNLFVPLSALAVLQLLSV